MDEFDQILPSNFPDPTDPDPTPNLANIDGDADATEDEGDYLPEQHAGRDNGDDPMGSGSRSKGKGVMSSMSEREKKDRQKEQNRKAAERSRAKKRQEQWAPLPPFPTVVLPESHLGPVSKSVFRAFMPKTNNYESG